MKTPVRVLMVITVPLDRNGIAACVLNYSERINSSELRVDVATPNYVEPEIRNRLGKAGVGLFEIPSRKRKPQKYFLELLKTIRKGRYDIVHAHGNSCTLAIELFAAQLAGCRIRIAHSHNTACTHVKAHKILRPLFELSCTERFACGQEAGLWLFHKKKFEIVRNGIDLNKYRFDENIREKMRECRHIPSGVTVLGHVGAFTYQKNHSFMIELMHQLQEETAGTYRLLLVGDGEDRSQIEYKIKQCGIQDSVIMAGNVDNVEDYLQAMDCFLLPSHFEGLPFVLIEAQAAGLPCLVSEHVSKEVRISPDIHFLATEDNIEEWKRRILNYDYTKHRRDRDLGTGEYDITAAAKKLKEIYFMLIRT